MRFAMNMKTMVALAGCLLLTGILPAQDPPKADPGAGEEYAVYAAALKEAVGGFSYVVVSTTTLHGKPEQIEKALTFPIEHDKLITQDLVKDFKFKNLKPQTIADHFPSGIRVTLISEQEESALFANSHKDGWKTFYEKYMGASGITHISRVGFNQKRDTAIVYVGNLRNWDAGGGSYLLLTKTDGEWKVVSQTRGWIT